MRIAHPAIIPLVLCLILPCATYAQESGETLTLQQAVDLALEHHPSLRAAEANIRAASGSLTQARAAYFPSLSASGSVTRNDGAFVFNPTIPARNQTYNNYTTGLQASQTLFDFGRTINRVSASSDILDASSLDYTASRAVVIVNVDVAYFSVVQARQVVSVNEEAVDQSAKHLAEAKAFYSVGRRPLFDVTKAEVDLANANVNLIRARNELRLSNLQLENAIGLHPRSPYILTDTLSVVPFAMTLDSVKTITFDTRPELLAAQARVEANRSLVTAAWDQNLPTLSATGSMTWSNFDYSPLFRRWSAGLTLSLPLFQGFAIAGQVEQAQAAADAAEANLQVLHESVVLEVEQSYFNLKEASDRLDATAKIVEQAEQNLLLAERQYAAGVGTALEATDAQLSLSNARISRIQALFDYNSALVQLRKAMGVLGK